MVVRAVAAQQASGSRIFQHELEVLVAVGQVLRGCGHLPVDLWVSRHCGEGRKKAKPSNMRTRTSRSSIVTDSLDVSLNFGLVRRSRVQHSTSSLITRRGVELVAPVLSGQMPASTARLSWTVSAAPAKVFSKHNLRPSVVTGTPAGSLHGHPPVPSCLAASSSAAALPGGRIS